MSNKRCYWETRVPLKIRRKTTHMKKRKKSQDIHTYEEVSPGIVALAHNPDTLGAELRGSLQI